MRSSIDGERRDPHVVLVAIDAVDDAAEVGGVPLGLDTELGGDRIEDVDIHALDGLAVAGQELIGGVGGVSADLDHARALDALRQLAGKVHVLADRDRGGTLSAGLAAQGA